jgi:hypothetical protein
MLPKFARLNDSSLKAIQMHFLKRNILKEAKCEAIQNGFLLGRFEEKSLVLDRFLMRNGGVHEIPFGAFQDDFAVYLMEDCAQSIENALEVI